MILLGIDPSLTATGLIVLDVTRRPEVLAHTVYRTQRKDGLPNRLGGLYDTVSIFVNGTGVEHGKTDRVICENPTTFKIGWSARLRNPETIGKLGAAFGVCLAACRAYPVTLVSQDWIPRHTAHNVFRAVLQSTFPCLKGLPDDAVFAGGVALTWWETHQHTTEAK